MRKFLGFWIFMILLGSQAKAQNKTIAGVFPTLDHTGVLSSKWNYSVYYFAAFPLLDINKPDLSRDGYFHLLYAEHALSFVPKDVISVTGSYVYQRGNVVYPNFENENRLYVQTKIKQRVNKINLVHRLRLDGRFVYNRIDRKAPFTHRLRYLIGFDMPVSKRSYITAYEEVFFNTHKGASKVYGENWAYAAYGVQLNPSNKLEAGILYVTWNTGIKSWYHQYYFQLTWINQINFNKKENKS